MNIHYTDTRRALLFLLLCALPLSLQAQTAGVGIYTEHPQGVFHVDAAANNPASSSATISSTQQADDVVISGEGYVGIGTITPTTQLHIHTQNLPGTFPLRLTDGAVAGKLLVSDDAGNVSWQSPPIPPSSFMDAVKEIAAAQIFTTGAQAEQATGSKFPIPEDGLYSIDIRFWGEGLTTANALTIPIQTITRFQLRRNRYGTGQQDIVDEYQHNEPSHVRVTTFVTLYASALQNDTLSLYIYPVEGFNSLISNPPPNYEWIKSKVLYKKLGVDDTTHYFD